jgi:hypothetical protein
VLLALALGHTSIAIAAAADADAQPAVPPALLERFRPCVDALGPRQPLPALAHPEAFRPEIGAALVHIGDAQVSDGYFHWLVVKPDERSVYIIQVGGFAPRRTVYGPLPLDFVCHGDARR